MEEPEISLLYYKDLNALHEKTKNSDKSWADFLILLGKQYKRDPLKLGVAVKLYEFARFFCSYEVWTTRRHWKIFGYAVKPVLLLYAILVSETILLRNFASGPLHPILDYDRLRLMEVCIGGPPALIAIICTLIYFRGRTVLISVNVASCMLVVCLSMVIMTTIMRQVNQKWDKSDRVTTTLEPFVKWKARERGGWPRWYVRTSFPNALEREALIRVDEATYNVIRTQPPNAIEIELGEGFFGVKYYKLLRVIDREAGA